MFILLPELTLSVCLAMIV